MTSVLAYGSLMWDNVLATYPGRRVRVEGRERGFVGCSTRRWGSPEHPCPQFGLVSGSGLQAVVFEVPARDRRMVIRNLKLREGTRPGKVTVTGDVAPGERFRALAFTGRDNGGRWQDRDAVVEAFRSARGIVGTGAEYVRALVHAMELWGIEDPLVSEIWTAVKA